MLRWWMVVIVAIGAVGGGIIGGCEDVTGPRETWRVMPLDSGNWWEYEWVAGTFDTLKFTKRLRIEVAGSQWVEGRPAAVVVWRWQSDAGEFRRNTMFWEERNGQLWQYWRWWGRVFDKSSGYGWRARVRWLPLADFTRPGWSYHYPLTDLDTVAAHLIDIENWRSILIVFVPDTAEYGARYEGRHVVTFMDTSTVALRYRIGLRVQYTAYVTVYGQQGRSDTVSPGCDGEWLWIWVVPGIGIVQFQLTSDRSLGFERVYTPCEPRQPAMWRLRRYSIR